MELDIDKLDFEHCEDEPIHIPELIQGYGYLFALDQTNETIQIYSENVERLIVNVDEIVGTNFFDLLEDSLVDIEFIRETYLRATDKKTRLPLRLQFKQQYISNESEKEFYAVVYNSDNYFVIELEPAGKFRETYSARHYMKLYGSRIAPKFKEYTSLDQLAQEIVDTIKYVTNMERVVLYRFLEDASGYVIAEAKDDDIESYLHLHFPASEIPQQARELYKKNWVRLVPNVDLEPYRLLPSVEESGRKPMDMSQSILRSLSPIHLQYVRNQGLKASMSMSLVTHDKLWGLISCHSRKPQYVPQNVRLECENLSQLFSWHLYAKEEEFYIKKKEFTDKAIDNLLNKNQFKNSIIDIFTENEKEVLEIVDADGFMFYTKDESVSLGHTPELSDVLKITEKARLKNQEFFTSRDITEYLPGLDFNGIKGVMLVSLLEQKNYFTAWFRKEKKEVERWVGNRDEKNIDAPKKERLKPRSSFAVNEVIIENKSPEWVQQDIDIAERFNKVFMAYALSTHESMRQDISDLRIQDRYKDEFLATLAHELRNPLSPILAGIKLMEEGLDQEDQVSMLSMMERQVNHMTTMINDLMDVSRITRGKVKLEMDSVPVKDIVRNAIETCKNAVSEKNHDLKVDLPDDDLYILGDVTRLSQVFVNILNNAVKYTPNGGIIEVKANQKGEEVELTIKDNGMGIPTDKLDFVFNMFTQMDSYTIHSKGGLGIGLTLVQKLVNLHKGSIKAFSDGKDKGSEFVVSLPVAKQAGTSIYFDEEKEIEKPLTKKKILVVDDNLDIISTYKIILKKEGFTVASASNGKDAIEKFESFKPDFALLDIGMPDMTGYELCKILKQKPEAKHTVFLSQSGWGNKEHEEKSKNAGFNEHLVKPLKMEVLKRVLKEE